MDTVLKNTVSRKMSLKFNIAVTGHWSSRPLNTHNFVNFTSSRIRFQRCIFETISFKNVQNKKIDQNTPLIHRGKFESSSGRGRGLARVEFARSFCRYERGVAWRESACRRKSLKLTVIAKTSGAAVCSCNSECSASGVWRRDDGSRRKSRAKRGSSVRRDGRTSCPSEFLIQPRRKETLCLLLKPWVLGPLDGFSNFSRKRRENYELPEPLDEKTIGACTTKRSSSSMGLFYLRVESLQRVCLDLRENNLG